MPAQYIQYAPKIKLCLLGPPLAQLTWIGDAIYPAIFLLPSTTARAKGSETGKRQKEGVKTSKLCFQWVLSPRKTTYPTRGKDSK